MLKLAVIGKDVSKSQSPSMHRFIMEEFGEACAYDKISVPPEKFHIRMEELFCLYDAFNVTIPYKRAVLPFLEELSKEGKRLGAVNTILTKSRAGFNTDGGGFSLLLETEGISVTGKRVLVLGAGGAGRSCIARLASQGAEVFVYEKNEERLKEASEELGGFQPLQKLKIAPYELIVNCTGVGMHDTVGSLPAVRTQHGEAPLPEEFFKSCETAVDLIYEPKQSEFLMAAARFGKRTVNGEGMLFYQAYLADCIILNRTPCAEEAKRLGERYKEKCK